MLTEGFLRSLGVLCVWYVWGFQRQRDAMAGSVGWKIVDPEQANMYPLSTQVPSRPRWVCRCKHQLPLQPQSCRQLEVASLKIFFILTETGYNHVVPHLSQRVSSQMSGIETFIHSSCLPKTSDLTLLFARDYTPSSSQAYPAAGAVRQAVSYQRRGMGTIDFPRHPSASLHSRNTTAITSTHLRTFRCISAGKTGSSLLLNANLPMNTTLLPF